MIFTELTIDNEFIVRQGLDFERVLDLELAAVREEIMKKWTELNER